MKQKIFFEIFDSQRHELFKQLGFARKLGMYLAGGTALALQFGHRTSVDFDFYIGKEFKKGEILRHFKKNLKTWKIKVIRDFDDTFEADINGMHLSLFCYPYKLLEKLIDVEGVDIVDAKDIAAMKLIAISQRGKRRDFVDMYYLISRFGLDYIVHLTEKKFPEFDVSNGLRGLLYVDDAEQDKEIDRIRVFDRKLKWREVKKYIHKEVFDFQRNLKK